MCPLHPAIVQEQNAPLLHRKGPIVMLQTPNLKAIRKKRFIGSILTHTEKGMLPNTMPAPGPRTAAVTATIPWSDGAGK